MATSLFDEKTEDELWLEYKKTRSPQLRDNLSGSICLLLSMLLEN